MSWDGDMPRSYQGGSGERELPTLNGGGREAPRPSIHNHQGEHDLTGLAEGDVPIGGVGTDGYAPDTGVIDKIRRHPLIVVGAAMILFIVVSHPGGGGGGGDIAAAGGVKGGGGGGVVGAGATGGSTEDSSEMSAAVPSSSAAAASRTSSGAEGFGFYDKGADEDDDHVSFLGNGGGAASHDEAAHDEDGRGGESSSPASSGGPKIAWLFAYPMSGASYVERLAASLDPSRPLSSVGANHIPPGIEHRPIFADSPEGPFFASFPENEADEEAAPGKDGGRYVLTMTDCSGHCPSPCPPSDFVETVPSYDAACRSTSWHDDGGERHRGSYGADRVARAVHMMRDPLSNVVSRFRAHRRRAADGMKKGEVQYAADKSGFQRYCKDADAATAGDEANSRFFPPDVLAAAAGVPCRDEFFKYVQWHNLAALEAEFRGLETLALYYEEFDGGIPGADPAGAIRDLREFLDMPSPEGGGADDDASDSGGNAPLFRGANMYLEYYAEEQRTAIWKMMKTMAFPKTWKLLQRYRTSSNVA